MEINDQLKEGDVVDGRVTGVQPYGIFIKLNDECSGLVHVTELDKLESRNPNRFFKIGNVLKVKVLRIKPGGKQAVLRIYRTKESRRKMGARNFETAGGFTAIKTQMSTWIEDAKDKKYI